MKKLIPRKPLIKKASGGLALLPIFTEADAGFPNGQQQLKRNQQRLKAQQEFENFINSGGLQRMVNRFYSVPDKHSYIPIYAEPDNTPEWIKNVYYFFNPSVKPKTYTKPN